MLTRLRQCELGLTLIETLASILIFSIITLGITPLLAGSLRGTAVSRSYTTGKNLSNRVLERARSLPFFQSVRNQTPPVRRDVLDLYFPSLDTADGYTAAAIDATSTSPARPAHSFMTTCTGTVTAGSRAAAACPSNLPAGYRTIVIARFVTPVVGSNPQTYTSAIPATGYNWSDVSTEAPPTTLLELSITSNWTLGTARTYNLTSFVGERRLSPELYSANARLNYVVRAVASYVGTVDPNVGVRSQLEAVAGTAESSISNRASSRADEIVTGGRITLTREQGSGTENAILAQVAGAPLALAAPPDAGTGDVSFTGGFSLTTDGPGEVIHPHLGTSFGTIAYLDDHTIEGVNTNAAVSPSGGAPSAKGRFSYTGLSGLEGASALFVNNQIERAAVEGQATQLQLDRTKNVMSVERQLSPAINGCTAASGISGPTSTGSTEPTCYFSNSANAVGAVAEARFGKLRLFPVTFIPATNTDTSVLLLDSFRMIVTCGSTSAPGSASATGSWSAMLTVWIDRTADDLLNGKYESFSIAGQTGPGATTQLGNIGNPLVYDAVGTDNDVYLFQGGGRKGYLIEGGLTAPALLASSAVPSTRTAQVNANTPAIQMVTVPTDPARPETSLTVDVGSMSCATVDKRGL